MTTQKTAPQSAGARYHGINRGGLIARDSSHATRRSTRALRVDPELCNRDVANPAAGCTGAKRESLISAEARSRASVVLETAPSSAAISAASDHAESRPAM